MTIRAAGILIVNAERRALFLKRGPGGDAPGMWCFPGGRIEDGEKAKDAAIRETFEEAGIKVPEDKLRYWTRAVSPRVTTGAPPTASPPVAQSVAERFHAKMAQDTLPPTVVPGEEVDFTVFIVEGAEEFVPKLGPPGDPEHVAYAWAPIDQPPQPLHPGCDIALRRLGPDFTELDLANAMVLGQLTSPQQFGKSWYFDMRITGTDIAFRHKHNEFVFRDPDLYLTEKFLQRCNGLPVILEHPAGNTLDGDEYRERNIGFVFMPYIRVAEKEVWGITRIIDELAAELLQDQKLSTSPAVVWSNAEVNDQMKLESGEAFLIEGNPSFVDHLAVCKQGVWDKGGEPTGIESTSRGDEENAMKIKLSRIKDEDDTAYAARCAEVEKLVSRADDGGSGDKLDAIIKGLAAVDASLKTANERMDVIEKRADADVKDEVHSLTKHDDDKDEEKKDDEDDEKEKRADRRKRADARRRADAFEFSKREDGEDDEAFKKRHDAEEKDCADAEMEAGEPEPVAADKAKKRRDAAEDGEKKEHEMKADKARGDSRVDALEEQLTTLKSELDATRAKLPKSRTDADIDQIVLAQSRADKVESMFGGQASRPLDGESLLAYRRRLLKPLAKHHPAWTSVDLSVIAVDEHALKIAEDQIYKAAADAAMSPATVVSGLREVPGRTAAGHPMTTFVGQPRAWLNRFMPTGRAVKTIDTMKGNRAS